MDDIDQTIPPRQHQNENPDVNMTIPSKRNRKPDGRFEVGDLILDRYKVLSELGQGGMGVVYRCFDETSGVEIALKALPPELSHNTLEMEDIRDNFRLVHNLHHPNIASYNTLERDQANGNYYLIMECVEGEDLRHWIRRKHKEGPLTVETILPIIHQVAEALDYAHNHRIIHRDIKPGNIMIDTEGQVKVLDFGLAAQIHSSMTRVSMAYHGTSGTAPYMAPEQWRGQVQGEAADQYALAVMTYEMLAGHLPFENTDVSVLREAVLNDNAQLISDIPKYALVQYPQSTNFPRTEDGLEIFFISDLGDARGVTYPGAGIIIPETAYHHESTATYKTLAHELGHACDLLDIYDTKGNSTLSDKMNPNSLWIKKDCTYTNLPNNNPFNNTMSVAGYYESNLKHVDLVKRLLMYGYGSGDESEDLRGDLSSGDIFGIDADFNFVDIKTGLEGMVRTPTHGI